MHYMYANIVQIIQNNGINDSGPMFHYYIYLCLFSFQFIYFKHAFKENGS